MENSHRSTIHHANANEHDPMRALRCTGVRHEPLPGTVAITGTPGLATPRLPGESQRGER